MVTCQLYKANRAMISTVALDKLGGFVCNHAQHASRRHVLSLNGVQKLWVGGSTLTHDLRYSGIMAACTRRIRWGLNGNFMR